MHLINLMVNYLYKKYGIPIYIFFQKWDQRYKPPYSKDFVSN